MAEALGALSQRKGPNSASDNAEDSDDDDGNAVSGPKNGEDNQ